MKKNLLNDLSIGTKLILISAFFLTALVGVVSYTVITLEAKKADSQVINIAGRQRMLTQKYTKEIFDRLAQQQLQDEKTSTESTTGKLFQVSLAALRQGGTTYADLAMKKPIRIGPATGDSVQRGLAEVEKLWKRLATSAQALLRTDPGSPQYHSLLQQVRSLNIETLKKMNSVVNAMAKNSGQAIANMIRAEWAILAFTLVASIFFVLLVGRSITRPMAMLVSATRQVAAGELDVDMHALQENRHDEMGQLAHSFAEMIEVLRSLEQELSRASRAAQAGDLAHRCREQEFRGNWRQLLGGMNQIIDSFTSPINETIGYLDQISRGRIPPAIETDYPGDFNQIKISLNRCIDAMNGMVGESSRLITAARAGRLETKGDAEHFEGSWKELVEGLNDVFSAMAEPVEAVNRVLKQLSEGDLTVQMEGNYQGEFANLRNHVNLTTERLKQAIGPVKETAETISSTATEIAEGNNNLSARTEQQASALEETASSMEEITSTVRNNAANARRVEEAATNARQLAEEGGAIVEEAIEAMNAINAASGKIAEIIGVIDEIAFQTNLLALNASVEAARAGEQGRGFAVVATEVRNLAGRSATAAKEIKELIEDSVAKVGAGARLVNSSGKTLGEIVRSVKQVSDLVGEIAAASEEQAIGIDQVNEAVTNMDKLVQQNAALAQEASSIANDMKESAQILRSLTSHFVTDGSSSGSDLLREEVDGGYRRNRHEEILETRIA